MKKTAVRLAAVIVALSVPLLITLSAAESIAFSERFYLQQHQILALEEATGFNTSDYRQFSQALWDYYRNRTASPQVLITTNSGSQPLYKEHELAHLTDVYHLFRLGVTVRNLAALLCLTGTGIVLGLRKNQGWPLLATTIAVGSFGGIALFLLLLLAVRSNFNQAFTYFHYLSFDNLLWQLDPAKDNLIRLFPEQFFLNATVAIARRALAVLTGLTALGFIPICRRSTP